MSKDRDDRLPVRQAARGPSVSSFGLASGPQFVGRMSGRIGGRFLMRLCTVCHIFDCSSCQTAQIATNSNGGGGVWWRRRVDLFLGVTGTERSFIHMVKRAVVNKRCKCTDSNVYYTIYLEASR